MGSRGWLLAAMIGAGCGAPRPASIRYGAVNCQHCHMAVADPRFSAELVTRRHKVYVFDDPGCLATFLAAGTVAARDVHSLWVSDFLEPDSLLDARRVVFLRTDRIRTPMDSRVIAVRPGARADSLRVALNGVEQTWDEVLAAASAQGQPEQ